MYPIVTEEKQKEFEKECKKNNIGSSENECKVPCICGIYGRACRNLNEPANSMLCTSCALSEYIKAKDVGQ